MQLDDMYSMVRAAKPGTTQKEYERSLASFNPISPNSPLTPESKKKIKNDDGTKSLKATYIYDVVVMYKDDKIISVTEPTNGAFMDKYKPSILDAAVEAFDKAITIGTEKEYVEDSKRSLLSLVDRMYNMAVNYYNAKKYLDAARYFERSSFISEKYFNKPNEENMKYAQECYRLEINDLLVKQDTTTALTVIEEGSKKFPENTDLMLQEAQIWLARGENNKVIEKLEKVTTLVKDNPALYFIIGQSYGNLKNEEKAIEAYNKALAIDSTNFESNYNIASIYFNKGTDLFEQAAKLPIGEDEAKYNELIEKSNKEFERAVPYLEKALAKAPEDIDILQALKSVYARLKNNEAAAKINEKIKEIQSKQ